jgi:hypothetical protein
MTNPDINVPVGEPVYKATKAIYATVILAGGWVALAIKHMSDGGINWAEGSELVGGAVTAVTAIAAVWATRNKPKGVR